LINYVEQKYEGFRDVLLHCWVNSFTVVTGSGAFTFSVKLSETAVLLSACLPL